MNKNLFSIILSILICLLLHLSDPGNGKFKAPDFIGLLIFFAIFFFISRWIFDKVLVAEKNLKQKNNSEKEINQIENDLKIYNDSKNNFKYLSSEKLTLIYENHKDGNINKMELLALEETLVERGILSHSPIREKLYDMQKYFESLKNK